MKVASTDEFNDVRVIADAICDEVATTEQKQELEKLLSGNAAAQRFYYDYLCMHIHLKSSADPCMEFVYRCVTQEFVVRPTSRDNVASPAHGQGDGKDITPDMQTPVPPSLINKDNAPFSEANNPLQWLKSKITITIVLVALLILAISNWFNANQASTPFSAEILKGHFSIVELGQVSDNHLLAGEYLAEQDAELLLSSGETLHLMAHSVVKLFNNNEIALKKGAITISPVAHNNIVVRGPNFSLYSNGGALSLDLRGERPKVITGENTFLLPNRWRPNHFWSFDSQSDRSIDSAGNAHGLISANVTRTSGLLGKGAFSFDNSPDARLNVGSGGGTAPATGSFAVTDGVTIEALVRPEYSAIYGDVDEVFRKDQTDLELRMLLSFQNDQGKDYLRPEGNFKESLSFGLYLVGQGYHELKLPLDGLNGRPTLAQLKQGNTHHIAATYNVTTGMKALYIDGVQLASYQYPPGSKMLSGGSGMANIGNSPNQRAADSPYFNAAFSGTIDEVAFYDFSLPPFMVNHHFKQIKNGQNYYGLFPSSTALPQHIKVPLPANTTITLAPLTGLPYSIVTP